jgi:Flp pilus assembly protein TadG
MRRYLRHILSSDRGQSLVEFSLVLPVVTVMALGVVELSYALLDSHIVTKLSREGSNLTSRDVTLADAVTALRSMSNPPVNFATRSTVILSVIKRGDTTGTTNYGKDILVQQYKYGAIAATSKLSTRGTVTFGAAPDYRAANPDNNSNLQLTNLPSNLLSDGGILYVTEIFSTHTPITPLDRFGISVPGTLYSIAYF